MRVPVPKRNPQPGTDRSGLPAAATAARMAVAVSLLFFSGRSGLCRAFVAETIPRVPPQQPSARTRTTATTAAATTATTMLRRGTAVVHRRGHSSFQPRVILSASTHTTKRSPLRAPGLHAHSDDGSFLDGPPSSEPTPQSPSSSSSSLSEIQRPTAAEFFAFAGVDIDPSTFCFERWGGGGNVKRETEGGGSGDRRPPPPMVYSAVGFPGGATGKAAARLRICWTTMAPPTAGEEPEARGGPDDAIARALLAFEEHPIERCWLESERTGGRIVPKTIRSPGDLAEHFSASVDRACGGGRPAVGSERVLVPYRQSNDATNANAAADHHDWCCVDPGAIDPSSLRTRSFYQWDGSVVDFFSAVRSRGDRSDGGGEETATIWWRTVSPESAAVAAAAAADDDDDDDDAVDAFDDPFGTRTSEFRSACSDPYSGVVSFFATDEVFSEFRRFSGGERTNSATAASVLRDAAMRGRSLANAIRERSSGEGWAFVFRRGPGDAVSHTTEQRPLRPSSPVRGSGSIGRFLVGAAVLAGSVCALALLFSGIGGALPGNTRCVGTSALRGFAYGGMVGLASHSGAYLRSLAVALCATALLSAAVQRLSDHRRRGSDNGASVLLPIDSAWVDYGTTLSVGLSAVTEMMLAAPDYALLLLAKVPVVDFLDALSVAVARVADQRPFRSRRKDHHRQPQPLVPRKPPGRRIKYLADRIAAWALPEASVFSPEDVPPTPTPSSPETAVARNRHRFAAAKRVFSGVLVAPIREELVFRFAFDRVWHAVASKGAGVATDSSLPLSPWVLANSLLFGGMHASSWLPVRREHVVLLGTRENDASGARSVGEGYDAAQNLLGALLHASTAFVASVCLLNPLYRERGLPASIGAHAAVNGLGGLLSLLPGGNHSNSGEAGSPQQS
ncbi:unnamed protein product [Pseudo-nitzschia multistriata]|uniref:CAAX prenyl protease 2/Lysostaphin resistance protein A-like domain-containing protein n=1 Tax=Pseudo-nitzschia multistriata TaxID=183589 RepID=A0A448YY77_9STRA|nr:unnamed protein product [Pseudo-nitzschia multistriata]